MKKFIKRITAFLGVLLLLLVIILSIINMTHSFLPSKMYYNEEFNSAFREGDFELIALGNSKLLSSLDKTVLEEQLKLRTVILGYSSSDISISRLTLESYLNKCVTKPKVVLLEVSWFTFNKKRTTFHSISGDLFLNDIKLWNKIPRYYPEIIENFRKVIIKQLYSKFNAIPYIDYSSKINKSSPNTRDYKFEYEGFEDIFPNCMAGIDSLLLEDFKSVIELCRKNEIHLVMYTAPEDEEYSSLQKDIDLIKSVFLNAVKKNDRLVWYLDYTTGGDLFDKKYELWLSNSHHINERDLFTFVLTKDIKLELNNIFNFN